MRHFPKINKGKGIKYSLLNEVCKTDQSANNEPLTFIFFLKQIMYVLLLLSTLDIKVNYPNQSHSLSIICIIPFL